MVFVFFYLGKAAPVAFIDGFHSLFGKDYSFYMYPAPVAFIDLNGFRFLFGKSCFSRLYGFLFLFGKSSSWLPLTRLISRLLILHVYCTQYSQNDNVPIGKMYPQKVTSDSPKVIIHLQLVNIVPEVKVTIQPKNIPQHG